MHFFPGWRRDRDGAPAASGLTGAPEEVELPPEPPKDWRERWSEVKQAAAGTMAAMPRVIRLVWQASPGLTVALFAGITPAATAYTAKLLINAVVRGIQVHLQHLPDRNVLDVPLGPLTWHSPVL